MNNVKKLINGLVICLLVTLNANAYEEQEKFVELNSKNGVDIRENTKDCDIPVTTEGAIFVDLVQDQEAFLSDIKLYEGIIELPRVDSIIAYNYLSIEQQKFVNTTLIMLDFVFAEPHVSLVDDSYIYEYIDLHKEKGRKILGRDLTYKLMQDINAYSLQTEKNITPLHWDGGRCECGLGADDGRCSTRYPCEETNCTHLRRKGCGNWWWNICDGECGHP
jgi:hypothetical protein